MEQGTNNLPKVLESHLAVGNFDHAYLFLGPKFAGKLYAAERFASRIFETKQWDHEFLVFDFEETAKIDQVREFTKKIALTPSGNGKRVVLFANFELASEAAISSLLKTVEEPPPGNIIVITANASRVLPTIMSRCTIIRFTAVSGKPIKVSDSVASGLGSLKSAFGGGVAERLIAVSDLAALSGKDLHAVLLSWVEEQKQLLGFESYAVQNCRIAEQTIVALRGGRNTKLILQDFLLKTKI